MTPGLALLLGSLAWGGEVAVSVEAADDGATRVEGRFTTGAAPEDAWRVLTDYERIPEFVSSMRYSSTRAREPDGLLLAQESTVQAFFFKRRFKVLLRVREEAPTRISFRDVSGDSFELYAGSWEIARTPGGSEIVYRLLAKGGHLAPKVVARGISRRAAQRLLEEVRAEITRRARRSAG